LQSGGPDWANFRQLGGRLLWEVFLKITEVATIVGLLILIAQGINVLTFYSPEALDRGFE
jgi:hypothetical protein